MSEQIDLTLSKQQLTKLKEAVMALMNLVDDAVQPVELDQNKVGRLSRVDAMQGQAMAQASLARQKQVLVNIEQALSRIDSGDYGRCIECDGFIAVGRLEIDPAAEMCINCAHISERR